MRSRNLSIIVLACCIWLLGTSTAQAEPLLELTFEGTTYAGRLVAHDDSVCFLMGQDGALLRIPLAKVTDHRRAKNDFRRLTSGELRDQLRREFGKDFEVRGTSHYLVCALPGHAQQYAELFEDIYRSFCAFMSSRGFSPRDPEFPLVAVVLSDQRTFFQYCRHDGIPANKLLRGYYLPLTNRVAVYDEKTAPRQPAPAGQRRSALERQCDELFSKNGPNELLPFGGLLKGSTTAGVAPAETPFAVIEADLASTIIHETAHQAAFNTGLHSRMAPQPKWLVEGFATLFEAPGVRNSRGTTAVTRINRERFVNFGGFVQSTRPANSLGDFVQDDELFNTRTLDAYSQAWALTFFLVETRFQDYMKYLQELAKRDPLLEYTPEERLADFKTAFGDDLAKLEAEFLTYIRRLNQ